MLKKAIILLASVLTTVGLAQGDVTASTLVDLTCAPRPTRGRGYHQAADRDGGRGRGARHVDYWLLVHTRDGQHAAWMAIKYLQLDQAIRIDDLPYLTAST